MPETGETHNRGFQGPGEGSPLRGLLEAQRRFEAARFPETTSRVMERWIDRLHAGETAAVIEEMQRVVPGILEVIRRLSARNRFEDAINALEQEREINRLRVMVAELLGEDASLYGEEVKRLDQEIANIAGLVVGG